MSDQPPQQYGIGGPPSNDPTQSFPTFPPAGPPGPPTAGYPAAPPGAYPPPPPGAQGGGAPPPKSGRGVVIGAVVVVVVVLLVTAGVLFVVVGGDDDESADDRGTTTTEQDDDASTTTASTEPDDTTTESTEPASDEAVDSVVGSWSGTYDCAQGLTVLDLDIEPGDAPGEVTAVFSFSAHPSNPDVPSGSFEMSGTASAADGLVLEPGDWIDQPPTFSPVGLTAPLPTVPNVLQGQVQDAPGCTRFQVSR